MRYWGGWLMIVWLAGCSSAKPPGAPRDRHDPSARTDPAAPSPAEGVLVHTEHAVHEADLAAARATAAKPRTQTCARWPLWEAYAARFISHDGRVIDPAAQDRSTSEGQAYAAFFALVAGDRARFDRMLEWTQSNLAAGNLRTRLPAWHWGQRDDGSWGVIDDNAASDADLWLAYTLLEASRIWSAPRYAELAHALAASIVRDEVVEAPGLGAVLLPGPRGFARRDGVLRLNPSYLALPLLRRMHTAGVEGPWRALFESTTRVLSGSAPRALAPDWVVYAPGRGFRSDPEHRDVGSYDAIRVYLWAALWPDAAPGARRVRQATQGLYAMVKRLGRVPERIHVRSARASRRDGPPGFWAVALACAHARRDTALATALAQHLEARRHEGLYGQPPRYYDQNLALFALGHIEGRYAFSSDGRLIRKGEGTCASR